MEMYLGSDFASFVPPKSRQLELLTMDDFKNPQVQVSNYIHEYVLVFYVNYRHV
jgi:hypothetical protein